MSHSDTDVVPSATFDLSTRLLEFALHELGWLITIVPLSFLTQHDEVCAAQRRTSSKRYLDVTSLSRTRPAWTSLYLGLLSTGMLYARKEATARWGVTVDRKAKLAHMWFRGAIANLLAQSLCFAKPTLLHLQTFCVLTLLFQPFGWVLTEPYH